MNIFKIFGKKSISSTSDPGLAFVNGIYNRMDFTNVALSPYLLERCYRGIVATCVDLKSRFAASAKPIIKRNINQTDSEELNKHPFTNILSMPNKYMTMYDLMIGIYQHLEIYGNAYLYIPKGALGTPATYNNGGGIWLLQSKFVEVQYKNGIPIRYKYGNNTSNPVFYNLDEVIHIKYPNPFNTFEGMSTIQKAYAQIQIDMNLTNYQANALLNDGTLKAVLKSKGKLTSQQKLQLQNDFNNAYAGVNNAGKVPILENIDYQSTGLSIKDLDYVESKKYFKTEIYSIFGVHIGILEVENVNKANSESGIVIFNHMLIKTMLNAVASAFTLYLKQTYSKDLFIEFCLETPELPEFKFKQTLEGVKLGAISLNEYRMYIDYDPSVDLNGKYFSNSKQNINNDTIPDNMNNDNNQSADTTITDDTIDTESTDPTE